ncbi:MAG TPA: hypothetical protein VFU55_06440 [Terracidiphilus sp.]|nr:hypothetical protein [Terracidiphilus sp.]
MTRRVKWNLKQAAGPRLRCFFGCAVLICAFSTGTFACGQVDCVQNHRPCTTSESKQMQNKICLDELAPANLFVSHSVRLRGTFFDPSGAPLNFDSVKPDHHTIVQIKSIATGAILYAVPLHSDGEFEFQSVPEDKYRLILVWMKNGRFKRLPLVDQPSELQCAGFKECRITSTIKFHGSDNPIDSCPPK